MHVLRDPHAPENHGALRASEALRDGADGGRVDAADIGYGFRAVILNMLFQADEVFGKGLQVLDVKKLLLNNHVHDCIEERHVAAGLELQHVGCVLAQCHSARVNDDELRAALCRLLEESRGDWMVLCRVGPDHHDNVGVLNLIEGSCHCAGPHTLDEGGNGRSVAKSRAVIDVVVLEARSDKFLEEVSLFIGTLSGAETGYRLVAVVFGHLRKPLRRGIERLLPTRFPEVRQQI